MCDDIYTLFGCEEKIRGKKMERKKIKKKENEEKSMSSLPLFGLREKRRENMKKKNEKYVK